jgi:Dolichyl-phosphate-mannose-protein mannosyltransferase
MSTDAEPGLDSAAPATDPDPATPEPEPVPAAEPTEADAGSGQRADPDLLPARAESKALVPAQSRAVVTHVPGVPLQKAAGAEFSQQETGILIRPTGWTADQIDTALIDMTTMRRALASGDPEPPPRPARSLRERLAGLIRGIGVSRWLLVGILALQALLSHRNQNTAFEDEALYLYSGHLELGHLLSGTPLQIDFSSYFTGSPVLYPVLGAIMDQFGGLTGARVMNLAFMLGTTTLLFMTAKRLFDERVAVWAAALFSLTEATIFLGYFATYDAPSIFMFALAGWIVVRTAPANWPLYPLAAFPAVLGAGTEYASVLYIPTVVVMSGLAALPYHGRRALFRPVVLTIVIAAMVGGALKLAGKSYVSGVVNSTAGRTRGATQATTILTEGLEWGGLLFAVAVIGAWFYIRRPPRTEEGFAPAPPRGWRVVLALVLVGGALIPLVYQIHLLTDVSFQKHIGFGLLFAAPMAGYGMVRLIGNHFSRLQLGIGIWVVALAVGLSQTHNMFYGWPNTNQLISAMRKYQKPHGEYLVEVDEVPIYYMRGDADAEPDQFTSTFNIGYVNKTGQYLTGNAGYEAAVKDGYFQMIVYNGLTTPSVDQLLTTLLNSDSSYELAAAIPESDAYGTSTYYIWVKK